ncbi:unnamed protein product [Arabis nemorensis]|uniref:Uncharacterized protein n=1 Tax=Arabis nemorensis TaxID=586526 RepID=A0A565CTJ2_9BRAS|nr:unnamed protein product [Arabis nemorensis]
MVIVVEHDVLERLQLYKHPAIQADLNPSRCAEVCRGPSNSYIRPINSNDGMLRSLMMLGSPLQADPFSLFDEPGWFKTL